MPLVLLPDAAAAAAFAAAAFALAEVIFTEMLLGRLASGLAACRSCCGVRIVVVVVLLVLAMALEMLLLLVLAMLAVARKMGLMSSFSILMVVLPTVVVVTAVEVVAVTVAVLLMPLLLLLMRRFCCCGVLRMSNCGVPRCADCCCMIILCVVGVDGAGRVGAVVVSIFSTFMLAGTIISSLFISISCLIRFGVLW